MMKRKMREYTMAFRQEAVRLAETSGKSYAAVERELGITPGLLCKWRTRYGPEVSAKELPPSVVGNAALRELEGELKRVKRELAIAQEERDILKKCIAVFTRERP